ncbi:uncharacterized protein N7484_001704 [Penicillium longicatenatum]|uniref:uncharacterized protein n=1 Tax=Penicillium longicatenatum TaxID=1561947 RepID=UPI002549339D|nr:uncharacterized protein N7484_001704 [Penicillium longicatenatum]KAJ5658055.1 hypothetical protein N7484_001704 [Penicillium longicatenatum]
MDHHEISAVHTVLHLIYHRNKNQHQRAKWWKWLSTLKRTTLDLGSLDSAAVERYQQHLAMHLIPRCSSLDLKETGIDPNRAFSTVVAENQFATLGIALLAALARLAKATGADRKLKSRARLTSKKATAPIPVEDRGERIRRDDALPEPSQPSRTKSVKKKAAKPKTTKRKKDAIDDLFSGLF